VRKLNSLLKSSVIPYRECGASIHRALRSVGFLRRLGLFEKMNSRFVAIVSDQVRRLFQA
jgi:hypothetical protein